MGLHDDYNIHQCGVLVQEIYLYNMFFILISPEQKMAEATSIYVNAIEYLYRHI